MVAERFMKWAARNLMGRRAVAALALATSALLSGCHNFFVCANKGSCPATTTTSGGGNYVYLSNASTGSGAVAAYNISGGTLTAIGSPVNVGFVPIALSIAPSDSFLYVATIPGATSPGIYRYSIGSDGALTVGNGGSAIVADQIASMDISPDGNFLFTVNSSGQFMNEYKVNTSTGALTLATAVALPGISCSLTGAPASQSCTVKVSPAGNFVVVALGTAGDAIFPYSSTAGLTSNGFTLIPSGTTTAAPSGDFSVALDKNNFAYIARTSALAVYSIAPTGAATAEFTTSYSSSAVPRSVVLSNGYSFVYTANEGAGTISEFGIGSGGTLSQLSGSPLTGPANVSALGVDKTGSYLVAAGYNGSSGVQLFAIGTNGALSLKASAGSGTSTAFPAVLAMTH